MIFVKSLNLGAGLTIAIISPMIFLVIYSMARIKLKKRGREKYPQVAHRLASLKVLNDDIWSHPRAVLMI
jgi:hypothetical protein